MQAAPLEPPPTHRVLVAMACTALGVTVSAFAFAVLHFLMVLVMAFAILGHGTDRHAVRWVGLIIVSIAPPGICGVLLVLDVVVCLRHMDVLDGLLVWQGLVAVFVIVAAVLVAA